MTDTVYVALGSNLDKPKWQLQQAVYEIGTDSDMTVTACSRLYRSNPVGHINQPDYFNAVVAIHTTLEPLQLLTTLQSIENSHNRVRSMRWGPRTLDLDIIIFGEYQIQSERLTIPHCQMHARNFVLCPLFDVAPDLVLHNGQPLKTVVDHLDEHGLHMISEIYPWN